MFDGGFDPHFAELFATSLAESKDFAQSRLTAALLFAATLGLIAVVYMGVIR